MAYRLVRRRNIVQVVLLLVPTILCVCSLVRLLTNQRNFFVLPLKVNPIICEYLQLPRLSQAECDNLDVLVVIHSAPMSFERRRTIRETWTTATDCEAIGNGTTKALFIIGNLTSQDKESGPDKLNEEILRFGDIIQYSAPDTYKNLLLKSLTMLHYHQNHCNAKLILKVDDDVIFHIDRFLARLERRQPKDPFVVGLISSTSKIIRKKSHQWYVPEDALPGSFFPIYAKGLSYGISGDAVPILLDNIKERTEFSIEDAYVTGVLAVNTSIKHIRMNMGVVLNKPINPTCRCEDGIPIDYTAHSFKDSNKLRANWETMKKQKCTA